MEELDGILAKWTPAKGLEGETLVDAIAAVHEHLLFVHPVREGNGRLARWVADLMSFQADRDALDWSAVSDAGEDGRQAYFDAVQAAHAGRMDDLKRIIRRALESS